MKLFSVFAAFAIVGLVTNLSLGQEQQPTERRGSHHNFGRLLKRADTNGDGKISREEWRRRPEAFDRIDRNRDGYITQDEAEAAARERSERRSKRGERVLERFDRNHDGQISRDEWAGKPELFDRLDRNHDGFITRDEFTSTRHRAKRR